MGRKELMVLNPVLSATDHSHGRTLAVRLATEADLSYNAASTHRALRL